MSDKELLESIFFTVDSIKSDLSQAESFSHDGNSFTCKFKPENSKKRITAKWIFENGSLKRNSKEIISAKDLYFSFFPESNSVLYRLEVEKNQIRGYIFLTSLKKTS